MADTERTYSQLIADLADSQPAHATNRQMLRNMVKSVHLYPTLVGETGVVSERYPYGDVRRYGGVMDGATVGDTAWTNTVTACQAQGIKLILPAGILQLTTAPSWPAGLDIDGQGADRSSLRVSGAVNGLYGVDAGPTYALSGRLRGFTMLGAAGALAGISAAFRTQPRMTDVKVTGFARQGVYFNNCIMPQYGAGCLTLACGGASYAQVEFENCTTVTYRDAYISTGNSGVIAGLAIDKTSSFTVEGGAIESSGIPIRLCGKADATVGVNSGEIGPIDLENPNGTADCYIELGAGWTGAQYQGVTRLSIGSLTNSPSGSTSVKYGIKAQNTDTVHVRPCKWGTPAFASGGVSNIELVGVNNIRWTATPQSSALGVSLIYVRENGVERKDAKPYQPWDQNGRNLVFGKQIVSGTTPDCAGSSFIVSNNGGVTNVTNVLGGSADGQLLVWLAGDSLSTLKHNAGGVGNIWLFDQKDHLARSSDSLVFIYDLSATTWRQIGHSVSTLGPGTGDNALMTNTAGQISFVANGIETDISFNITPKGAGFVKLNISSQFGALRVGNVASGNYMEIYPNVAGSPPRMAADGADTNIDLRLDPKGTGVVDLRLPATIANGGGAVPTFGTIGGSGPTAAAQTGWLKVKVNGSVRYIPVWA